MIIQQYYVGNAMFLKINFLIATSQICAKEWSLWMNCGRHHYEINSRKDGFDADDGHLIIIFKNNKVIYINGSGLVYDYVKEFNKEFKLENYK